MCRIIAQLRCPKTLGPVGLVGASEVRFLLAPRASGFKCLMWRAVNIHCMLYLRYDIFCATTMLLFVLDNNPHNWQVFCRQTDSLLEIGSNTDEWTII